MKISVDEASAGEETRRTNLDDITHQDLADLWASGVAVAANHGEKSKVNRSGFGVANAVMARIDLHRLPLMAAMEAAFTQQFASVVAHSQHGSPGELLIAFELPTPVTDAKQFVRLMAGVETLYAGAARHGSALERYGLGEPGEALVLGNRLDAEAVRLLDILGRETKELRRGKRAFMRSRNPVDRSTVLRLHGGGEAVLEQLPKHHQVFCPVHVDVKPLAVVHWYPDGTPGVQCSHCRRTYAGPNTTLDYDFDHFDRVVLDLSEQKDAYVDKGVVYEESDVTYLQERYLPPLGMARGVTFVKSPKGTNKTGALEALVAECKRNHVRVLMIGHRRALLQSVADRLKIDCYFAVEGDDANAASPISRLTDAYAATEAGVPTPAPDRIDDGTAA